MMMDLSEMQQQQRKSFCDVYLKVLIPLSVAELGNLSITYIRKCISALKMQEYPEMQKLS